jgi:predicted phosphohydrolase
MKTDNCDGEERDLDVGNFGALYIIGALAAPICSGDLRTMQFVDMFHDMQVSRAHYGLLHAVVYGMGSVRGVQTVH